MFDFTGMQMKQLVVHHVGNKLRGEGFIVSPSLHHSADGNAEELLLRYFSSSFKEKVLYKFFHETDLHLNPAYMHASSIFIRPESFYEQSLNLLQHLYEKSVHPQIKGGEFYAAYFSGCRINGQEVDALGMFKTERRDPYLKVVTSRAGSSIAADQGINIRRLDKGAFIFHTESTDGYRVAIVDAVSKGDNEAMYWKEEFLRLTDVQNEYFHTRQHVDLCRDFAENVYGAEYQADKKDQVMFVHNALAYLEQEDEFQLEDFVRKVVREPELIERFREHKQLYEINQGLPPAEAFSISEQAVKTAKRNLKGLIKLDTAIEIKVKTATAETAEDFIERGYDEKKGMHFYKVYFNAEE